MFEDFDDIWLKKKKNNWKVAETSCLYNFETI